MDMTKTVVDDFGEAKKIRFSDLGIGVWPDDDKPFKRTKPYTPFTLG